MAVNLSPIGGVAGQFFDNNGNPLTGGKIYTYTAGTSTNQATYTSAAGFTAHTNPIILDAGGRVPSGEIWLTDGLQYKFVLKTSTDTLIGTYDNVVGINSNFVNFTNQQEIQTATANQTVFTLASVTYSPGTNNLSVFVDGVNQYNGVTYSYAETSSTVITFTAGLHVGALVKFTTAQTLSTGVTDSSLVTYTPAGTGAVATTVQTKLRESVSVLDFGADPTGVADSTAAFALAVASGAKEVTGVAGHIYKVTQRIQPANGQRWAGNGAKIIPDYSALGFTGDVFYMAGSNTSGQQSQDIVVDGWIIDATGTTTNVGFGVQTNGQSFTYAPTNIKVRDNTFKNCPSGGVFVAQSTWVQVTGNHTDGGSRAVGVFASIVLPNSCSNILVSGNTCVNTVEYGIQTYYGYAIAISGNDLEGSALMLTGDRSCITVDRSSEVSVVGNITRNAPIDQIYVTGSRDVVVSGNTCVGGTGGIQVNANFEYVEDASIHESLNVSVTGNACNFNSDKGIIFNGVQNSTITGNSVRGTPASGISVIEFTRGDAVAMQSLNISVIGNSCEAAPYFQQFPNGGGTGFSIIGNYFSGYAGTGILPAQIAINNNPASALNFGQRQIENFGLLKRTDMPASLRLQEYRLADESYHKGCYVSYDYGTMYFSDSTGVPCFGIGVGEGSNKKDMTALKAGAGFVVTSPNGLVTKRIGIDNAGSIVLTTV